MCKCHPNGKSQANDYVFFQLSTHNTNAAPQESVIFIDEKIRTGLCSITCYMYAVKMLLSIHKAINITFQKRWI